MASSFYLHHEVRLTYLDLYNVRAFVCVCMCVSVCLCVRARWRFLGVFLWVDNIKGEKVG